MTQTPLEYLDSAVSDMLEETEDGGYGSTPHDMVQAFDNLLTEARKLPSSEDYKIRYEQAMNLLGMVYNPYAWDNMNFADLIRRIDAGRERYEKLRDKEDKS